MNEKGKQYSKRIENLTKKTIRDIKILSRRFKVDESVVWDDFDYSLSSQSEIIRKVEECLVQLNETKENDNIQMS